jgi:hypothetical protein
MENKSSLKPEDLIFGETYVITIPGYNTTGVLLAYTFIWRQYMAKYHNNNLPLDGRWSADGYINQDGWWFNEFEDLFISSIENEITLDEFISFFYPHKKLKKFRIWEIKI